MIEPDVAPAPPRAKSRRAPKIVGALLVLSGVGGLAAWAVAAPGALSYYTTPSEALDEAGNGRSVRLGGRVADGTLERDRGTVRFSVTDGEATVPVVYAGDVPDTLQEATDVIAEGTLSADGTLTASRVLAKCSSKFVAEDEPAAHDTT